MKGREWSLVKNPPCEQVFEREDGTWDDCTRWSRKRDIVRNKPEPGESIALHVMAAHAWLYTVWRDHTDDDAGLNDVWCDACMDRLMGAIMALENYVERNWR